MSDIAIVFDTSALLSYVAGSIAVGELIAEIADEDRRVAVPAACLAQARAAIADDLAAAHLLLLTTTPTVLVVPLGPDGQGRSDPVWRVGEFALAVGGDVGAGHAAYVALDHEAHLATTRPDIVTPLMPAGWSILDLR